MNQLKKIFLNALLLTIALFLLIILPKISRISAQENPDSMAPKYSITFPIPELGGCQNYSDCRAFCEDPLNYTTCIDFAKKKGFYKEESLQNNQQTILNAAKTQLGCDSYDSCRDFCSQEANLDKCTSFARTNNLQGGQTSDPAKTQILEKAKNILGCDSYTSCKAFCTQDANRQKCSDFAKAAGLSGGEHQVGPGGCTSEETCKAFCSDPQNYQICTQYSQAQGSGKFTGPGGCSSETSCKAYCQSHPEQCKFKGEESDKYNPAETCTKTPNCAWIENSCRCGTASSEPKTRCEKYPGCSWSGTSCQCPNDGSSSISPYPTHTSGGEYFDQSTECTKHSGCSWTGSTCQCSPSASSSSAPTSIPSNHPQETSNSDPASLCQEHSGCSWTGSTCQCSNVKGAATQQSILDFILQFLFGH